MMSTIKPFFKMEMRALSREYVSLFFMIVLPMILTIVFGGAFGTEATQYGPKILGIDTVVPVNVVFLLANTGLMGVPITVLEVKDQGVLKRYITYPVSYGMYFLALMLTFMIVCILSTVLFMGASFIVYGATWFMNFKSIVLFIVAYFDTMFIFFIFFYFRFEFPHNNMMYHFSTSFLIFSCFLCILYFFVLHCLQRFLESYCKQDRRKRHSQQICRRFCKVNSHRFI